MRILADENVSRTTVRLLRERSHDVVWIKEVDAGIADPAVLDRAQRERRVVVTFDKQFGDPAFRDRLAAEHGILLLRVRAATPDDMARLVVAAV